ncbi:MAG: hypothetical protein CL569_18320 [Alphaproteobacteria bacterium]|nr:hypothetical protein [Alphaproteobacteria bacterium]
MDGDGTLADLSVPVTRIALAFSVGAIAILTDKIDRVVSALLLAALVFGINDIIEMAQPENPAVRVVDWNDPSGFRPTLPLARGMNFKTTRVSRQAFVCR